MKARLAVYVGGTSADIALAQEMVGRISIAKVPSTPYNPALAVVHGIKRAFALLPPSCASKGSWTRSCWR